jgi:hypothetical protein
MNPTIRIAIIISAFALVGMVSIAVNYYSPAPAHAQKSTNKGWCIPGTQQQQCYQTKKDCESHLPADSAVSCFKARR